MLTTGSCTDSAVLLLYSHWLFPELVWTLYQESVTSSAHEHIHLCHLKDASLTKWLQCHPLQWWCSSIDIKDFLLVVNAHLLPVLAELSKQLLPAADPYSGPSNHLYQFYLHAKSQLRSLSICQHVSLKINQIYNELLIRSNWLKY